LFILPRVSEPGFTGSLSGYDTGFAHERIGQGGLPMIHMGYHRHVADIRPLVHDGADLIDCEVNLSWKNRNQCKIQVYYNNKD
jgi:hypothetical protein